MAASGDDGPSLPGFIFELRPLTRFVDLLVEFASNPRRFVVGAVLTTALEVTFGVVSQLVDIVLLVFGGSQPGSFNAPGETLGIADVPVAIAEALGGVGLSLGTTVIATLRGFNATVFEAAGTLGPLSPVVVAAIVVGEVVVAVLVLRRIVFVVADLLQLGGLTE